MGRLRKQRRKAMRESRRTRTFILVRHSRGVIRIETTTCRWCGEEYVCSACHEKANVVRRNYKPAMRST